MTTALRDFAVLIREFEKKQSELPAIERDVNPPPIDDKMALRCLSDLLLGEGFCEILPISHEQVNTSIVMMALTKNPKALKEFMDIMEKEDQLV